MKRIKTKEQKRKYNSIYFKKYYQKYKEHIVQRTCEYYSKHKEQMKKYNKKYYKENKEKIQDYKEKNKEKIAEKAKEYYQKNKERITKLNKKYYKENKEKFLKYSKKYIKDRTKTDFKFKIRYNLRNRVYQTLKGKNKSLQTMFLIGCDIDYLMYHIQCQFKDGMTWDNHGTGVNGKEMKEWHIDHIIPCSSFDLSKPEEQQKCFHYTNLQPLWAKENWAKG
jgi:actin-related protein